MVLVSLVSLLLVVIGAVVLWCSDLCSVPTRIVCRQVKKVLGLWVLTLLSPLSIPS